MSCLDATKLIVFYLGSHPGAVLVNGQLVWDCPATPSSVPSHLNRCSDLSMRLLYSWGSGSPNLELPPKTGLPIGEEQGQFLVMQVHYSNLIAAEPDSSGLSIHLEWEGIEYIAGIWNFILEASYEIAPHSQGI